MSSGDDVVSLKEFFKVQLDALAKNVTEQISSMDKATRLAAQSMEKRLEGMNEFRDTLRDQASKFVTRDEIILCRKQTDTDLRTLREWKVAIEAKASQKSVNITMGIAIIGLVVATIGLFIRFLT